MKEISVIIPCYNEKERLVTVINGIINCNEIREIIVVDDGSSQETIDVLSTLPKNVKVIRHPVNKGKAEAMKTGLREAVGEVVVFVDADLKGFTAKHLERLCKPIWDDKYDMSLGVRELDVFYARVVNFAPAYGGERAFNRRKLLNNIEIFESGGYLVEASMNKFYLRKGKVAKVFLNGVGQTAKYKKTGLNGLWRSFMMLSKIMNYIGINEFLFQVSEISKLKYFDEV